MHQLASFILFFETKFKNLWHITRLSTINRHKVINSQNQSGFFWPTLYIPKRLEGGVTAETIVSVPTKFCSVIKTKCSLWIEHRGWSLLSMIVLSSAGSDSILSATALVAVYIVQSIDRVYEQSLSAVLRSHVVCLFVCLDVRLPVCLSVTLVDHDDVGWKSWKLTMSPTSSLFVAQRSSTYSRGNMEKFWRENVRSTPTSITSGWIESTESHVILGRGVAVCLLLLAHRAVIFATAQLSCLVRRSGDVSLLATAWRT